MKFGTSLLRHLSRFPRAAVSSRQVSRHGFSVTSKEVADRFRNLPGVENNTNLTYVWIDGSGEHLRSKIKVSRSVPTCVEELKEWGFDGSSTEQARGEDSDLTLCPVRMCRDPFTLGNSRIVLCEVVDADGNPVASNRRRGCFETYEKCKDQVPTFGFEQEYTLQGSDERPFAFPEYGLPEPQGPYYCGAGAGRSIGRDICDSHLAACQYAELNIWGTNGEVMPGQWEFQTGPMVGVDAADHLWLSRYLLLRVGEEYGIGITYDPKPFKGDWNGAGCHTNFNTKEMQQEGGIHHILKAIERLAVAHVTHIKGYDPKGGIDNLRRLTGLHETAKIDEFTHGEAARNASIRIPRYVSSKGRGFLEDRRPAANMDPYLVTSLLMETCCLGANN